MQFFSLTSVVLGLIATTAVAAPAPAPAPAPADGDKAPSCSWNDRVGPRTVLFQSWITDCGDNSGHTTGMWLGYDIDNKACRPLPEHTRALEIHELAPGCRVTAFESPICSDYPYNGTWANTTRCLWFGNREFRSWSVTCGEE